MARLLNTPRDKLEALTSSILFLILYFFFVKIVYAQSEYGFFNRGSGYFFGRMVTVLVLYLLWFYSTRVLINYLYFNGNYQT